VCTVLEGRMDGIRTRGRQSVTMIDWMKSNDVEYDHIKKRAHDREKTGIIGGLNPPEKAEHTRENSRVVNLQQILQLYCYAVTDISHNNDNKSLNSEIYMLNSVLVLSLHLRFA